MIIRSCKHAPPAAAPPSGHARIATRAASFVSNAFLRYDNGIIPNFHDRVLTPRGKGFWSHCLASNCPSTSALRSIFVFYATH
jgi:hypothetical protein